MHEHQRIDTPMKNDIDGLFQLCLKAEQDRDPAKDSMKELKRYLSITFAKGSEKSASFSCPSSSGC